MEEQLIAPCGMNCALCIHYQAAKHQLNQKGFSRTTCPGCIPRGTHCRHMGARCARLGEGQVRFCTQCPDYPCRRLKDLDKRYRTKYHMSMLENLEILKGPGGMEALLQREAVRWQCPHCKEILCCHNGLCLGCQLEVLRENKRTCWDSK